MKLSDLSEGDIVVVDGGFTCREAGEVMVYEAVDGLYFECEHGRHYLDGQEDDDGNLVGISSPAGS